MRSIRILKLFSWLFVLSTVVVFATPAQAALITFDFTGTIQHVGSNLGVTPPFATNEQVSGSFTFDSTTPDAASTSSTIGQYEGAVKALDFMFGSYSGSMAAGNDGGIQVQNPNPSLGDSYLVRTGFETEALDGVPVNGETPDDFFFRIRDSTQTMLSSDALPLTPPTIWQNDGANLTFIILGFTGAGIDSQVRATVDSITLAAVPAPTTMLLMGTGLAGFILFRRRQDRVQRISHSNVHE